MNLPDNSQKRTLAIKTVFWTLVGIFVIMAIMIGVGNEIELPRGVFVSFLFGGGTKLKKFLILTGASVAGFFVSVVLHNFIYGLFIHFFGKDFWNRIGSGGDEPVFFILAIIVCPIGFLIGAIGSTVLFAKK